MRSSDDWDRPWVRGEFEIDVERHEHGSWRFRVSGPSSNPATFERDLIRTSAIRRFEVRGRRGARRLVGPDGVVAGVGKRHGRRVERLSLEADGARFELARTQERDPPLRRSFAPKRVVQATSGVLTDSVGQEALIVETVHTVETLRRTPMGWEKQGSFEGTARAVRPVPGPIALLALHLVLKPETMPPTGVWKDTGGG